MAQFKRIQLLKIRGHKNVQTRPFTESLIGIEPETGRCLRGLSIGPESGLRIESGDA
jgi:hypothetical protein